MDDRIKTLKESGDRLFSKRAALMSLWQEIADNFYVERADFTHCRNLGEDFASHLTTSYPLLCRRDLGNTFSSMLRPTNTNWFHIKTSRDDQEDNDAKRWLEWSSNLQRNAMYDPIALFINATKQGDHDFAAFGQCAISMEFNPRKNAMLYKNWHLRDVAWCEDSDGKISEIHRRWKPNVRSLNKLFKGNISSEAKEKLIKTPDADIGQRHVVVFSEDYESPTGKKWNTPYVSIFFEVTTGFVNEEKGIFDPYYIIPRWQRVSGSQYAYSPATVAALPDARLIQAMTLTLLEAGQKAVDPPLIATQEVVRSDMNTYAGGVTWVDAEYDERLGEALRPMTIDSRGLPFGMDLRADIKDMISQAFFLNKLNLPPQGGPDMTAYEVGQRVQEYIRNVLPLFEPMEHEYNGAICKGTFDIMMRAGFFGSIQDMPQSLRRKQIQFRFESPLQESVGQQKGQLFQNASGLLAQAAALDPLAPQMLDARTALRDTLDGIRVPAKWIRTEKQMDNIAIQAQQAQQAQQMIGLLQQGGDAAKSIGEGAQAINGVQQGATV